MAKPRHNLINMTFTRWTVINDADDDKNGKHAVIVKCRCGTVRCILAQNLLRGQSKSCGCLQKERASEVQKQRWASKRLQGA
jgi:hypothetical protein